VQNGVKKMPQIKQTEIRELITGVDYNFTLKSFTTAGGDRLYSFKIENTYGEVLGFTWLLSEDSVRELGYLFTVEQDDHS